ncbi:hypothetical protein P691DRAFT_670694, partial [Macrolepiota fuliginosa MF-IS2]
VHLIPTYSCGSGDHLGKTLACEPTGESTDWNYYYINMFADHDTFMHFLGRGVGHHSTLSLEAEGEFDLVNDYSDNQESGIEDIDEDDQSDTTGTEDEDNSEEEHDLGPEDVGPEDGEDGQWVDLDIISSESIGYGAYD